MVENTYDRIIKAFMVVSDEEIEVIERRRQLLMVEEEE
jgi:hypothetical protein